MGVAYGSNSFSSIVNCWECRQKMELIPALWIPIQRDKSHITTRSCMWKVKAPQLYPDHPMYFGPPIPIIKCHRHGETCLGMSWIKPRLRLFSHTGYCSNVWLTGLFSLCKDISGVACVAPETHEWALRFVPYPHMCSPLLQKAELRETAGVGHEAE